MPRRLSCCLIAIVGLLPWGAAAPTEPVPERIVVFPPRLELSSRRSRVQFVATGYFDGEPRDVTRAAEYASDNPEVVEVNNAVAIPKRDGEAAITVRVAGQSVTVPVQVAGQTRPDPIRFQAETLAVLTKQGCSTGSCHGAPEGKGGFALSLFAFAPHLDGEALVRGGLNRRINVVEPAESLLLKKPLMRIPHLGGKRLNKSDATFRVLYDWVAEGAHVDAADAPICERISVYPSPGRVLRFPHVAQQLSVVAHFSDGTSRDVTAIATYDVSHRDVAAVDANGLVTGLDRGQSAVTVRYLNHLASAQFTVVREVEGFQWTSPPENNLIDRLVHAKLRQLQIVPSDTCNDETIIRRVFLDLTGLLPAPEQTRAFLADATPDKRARLVDRLLDSREFARFWSLRLADLMRVNAQTMKDGRAEQFAHWVEEAYRSNMPFDRFATAILTASGDARENPPVNYFLGITSNEELAETTAHLFMGSRVNCAKCHNHPFENWTQADYYRLGAVFARVKRAGERLTLLSSGETKHPASGQTLSPWGAEAATDPAADRRVAFVRWLTRPGNPYFSRVEVNRVWAHLLGRGIVHPVDDFRSSNPPTNVELLDALASDFERSGYDRKQLIRLICASRTYQRSAATNRFNASDDSLFSHALVRRLSAEQIQDAVGLVTRTLIAPVHIDAEAARFQVETNAALARVADEFPRWLTATRRQMVDLPRWAGVWSTAGPFPAKRIEEVSPPERGVDLAARYENGSIGWARRANWNDGEPTPVVEKGGVYYYLRTLHARAGGPAVLHFDTSNRLKVWLNSESILDRPGRGFFEPASPPSRLAVNLRSGANDLLVKVNASGATAFSFTLAEPPGEHPATIDATPDALEILAAGEQTAEQRQYLLVRRQDSDAKVKSLRDRLERLRKGTDYATQRPYPEQTDFLRSFGQPKRESPCACERSSEPTIDQELQLLNGKAVADRLAGAAVAYAALADDTLADDLYLTAFARPPTPTERATIKLHMGRAGDRPEAIRDLVWAVVNTQEFLFQH
jgi:hypothetical protein